MNLKKVEEWGEDFHLVFTSPKSIKMKKSSIWVTLMVICALPVPITVQAQVEPKPKKYDNTQC